MVKPGWGMPGRPPGQLLRSRASNPARAWFTCNWRAARQPLRAAGSAQRRCFGRRRAGQYRHGPAGQAPGGASIPPRRQTSLWMIRSWCASSAARHSRHPGDPGRTRPAGQELHRQPGRLRPGNPAARPPSPVAALNRLPEVQVRRAGLPCAQGEMPPADPDYNDVMEGLCAADDQRRGRLGHHHRQPQRHRRGRGQRRLPDPSRVRRPAACRATITSTTTPTPATTTATARTWRASSRRR